MVAFGVCYAVGLICVMLGIMFSLSYVCSLFMHVTDHTRYWLITLGEAFLVAGTIVIIFVAAWHLYEL